MKVAEIAFMQTAPPNHSFCCLCFCAVSIVKRVQECLWHITCKLLCPLQMEYMRAALFSMFLVVPNGLLRALATRKVRLDKEAESDDESEADDVHPEQEQSNTSKVRMFTSLHACSHACFLRQRTQLRYNKQGSWLCWPHVFDTRLMCVCVPANYL